MGSFCTQLQRINGEAERLEESMWGGEDIIYPEPVDPEFGCKALVR